VTAVAAPGVYAPGAPNRLRDPVVPAIFFAGFAAILLVSLLILWRAAPAAPTAPCVNPVDCPPPRGPPRLVVGHPWKSASLGFSLEFDDSAWAVDADSRRGLELGNDNAILWIRGVRGANVQNAFELGRRHFENLAFELAPNRPSRRVLGAGIGYRRGIGSAYCVTIRGLGARDDVIILAASDGTVSVVAAIITGHCDKSPSGELGFGLQQADTVLNTFRWPSEARE